MSTHFSLYFTHQTSKHHCQGRSHSRPINFRMIGLGLGPEIKNIGIFLIKSLRCILISNIMISFISYSITKGWSDEIELSNKLLPIRIVYDHKRIIILFGRKCLRLSLFSSIKCLRSTQPEKTFFYCIFPYKRTLHKVDY